MDADGRWEMIEFGKMCVERDGSPVVMAEIGVNHDGDLGVARELIEAAKGAGADAVKFQLFEAGLLLAKSAGLVAYQESAAESAEGLLKPLELSAEAMRPLVAYAHELGMAALVTPFSVELVERAVGTGCDGIKLASPDLVNLPLLEAAVGTALPLVVSTGAASMVEIARTVGWLGKAVKRTVLLHCVSSYPTPPELATLGAIEVLRETFATVAVGYSDHTTSTLTGALAVAGGACFLEKHLTLDRGRKGPDHAASLEPGQMGEYVKLVREAFVMRGGYEKKVLSVEEGVRLQTRQSVVLRRDVAAGEVLRLEDLTVKRPGTGIAARELRCVVGRRLKRGMSGNTVLMLSDLVDG